MSIFDQMAGLSEGETLTRRSLRTLGEAGGAARSTPDTTTDYGSKPAEIAPSPNTCYRAQPRPGFGGDGTMKGKGTTAQARTSKPAQHNTK